MSNRLHHALEAVTIAGLPRPANIALPACPHCKSLQVSIQAFDKADWFDPKYAVAYDNCGARGGLRCSPQKAAATWCGGSK